MRARHLSRLTSVATALIVASRLVPPAHGQTFAPRPEVEFHGAFLALDTVGQPTRIAASTADAFQALRAVYAELHVDLTIVDSARGMLGTLRLVRSQSLGGAPLSRLVDCGQAAAGPFADNARVQLALVSFVTPGSRDSTTLRTALVAQAQAMDGASREPVLCHSTGFLESRVRRSVITHLRGHQ